MRRLVQQRVSIVGDQRIEKTGLDILGFNVNWSRRDAEILDYSLITVVLQDLNRSAGSHRVLEGRPLRVMEIDDLQLVQPEKFEASFEAALDHVPAIVVRC